MVLLAVGGIAATVEMRKMELRAAHMPPGVQLAAITAGLACRGNIKQSLVQAGSTLVCAFLSTHLKL